MNKYIVTSLVSCSLLVTAAYAQDGANTAINAISTTQAKAQEIQATAKTAEKVATATIQEKTTDISGSKSEASKDAGQANNTAKDATKTATTQDDASDKVAKQDKATDANKSNDKQATNETNAKDMTSTAKTQASTTAQDISATAQTQANAQSQGIIAKIFSFFATPEATNTDANQATNNQ